jgi:hypothetical protein
VLLVQGHKLLLKVLPGAVAARCYIGMPPLLGSQLGHGVCGSSSTKQLVG